MLAESLKEQADSMIEALNGDAEGYVVYKDELTLQASPKTLASVLKFLRDNADYAYTILIDITAVDYPERPARFDIVYNLLSITNNARIRVKIGVAEDEIVPSIAGLFSTAGWFEREVWDMYGIPFSGHPDLRRILTDYGFEGHPLRKDFPLTGYVEVRYDEEKKRVVYEPVTLTQDFRRFDFLSPWEGITDIQLPGDEKAVCPPHGWHPASKDPLKNGGDNHGSG